MQAVANGSSMYSSCAQAYLTAYMMHIFRKNLGDSAQIGDVEIGETVDDRLAMVGMRQRLRTQTELQTAEVQHAQRSCPGKDDSEIRMNDCDERALTAKGRKRMNSIKLGESLL